MNKAAIYCRELNKIAVALGSARDLSDVLNLITKRAVDVLNLKACSLGLWDRKTSRLEIVAVHGLGEKNGRPTQDVKDVPIEPKAFKGLPVVVTDFSKWLSPEEAEKKGIVSMLCVPVQTRYDRLGVVCVYSARKHKFSPIEADFLKSLGNLGAVAIENTLLSQRLERRLAQSEALLEISKALTSSLKPQEVFNTIAKTTTEAMKMKGCIVRLLNEKREKLEPVASYGLSEKYVRIGPIHINKGLEDVRTGEPAIVPDVLTDTRLQYPEETAKEGIRCELAVPLQIKGNIIGSIRVFGSTPHQFDEDEVKYLEAIASHAAMAIENARLYRISLKNWQDLVQEVWEKSEVWGQTKIETETK